MSRAPRISVITPFFQVGAYLQEAIESVLAQTYDDWELILVDDGSTDTGREIARDFAADHPDRIMVLEHPGHANRGISAARNLGASHARGEWIASLDGDDVWLPEALADRARIIDSHPEVGLVMGASLYWHSWAGKEARADDLIPVGALQDAVHQPPRLLEVLYPTASGAAPSMNTVLVRADVLKQIGGWEEEFPTAYEDQALLAKLYLVTPAYVSSNCWDLYRQRPGSCSEVELHGSTYHFHRRRFLEWFGSYLDRKGGPEAIRNRVHAAQWQYRHPILHGTLRAPRYMYRFLRAFATR